MSEQSLYNLAARTVELELIPSLEHYGVGLIPWSPLGGGLLAGALQNAEAGSRRSGSGIAGVPGRIETLRPQLEAFEDLCRRIGESPADVAVAWLLSRPVVSSVIVGSRIPEQFTGSTRALDMTLDDETLRTLEEIWPGPGRAPEAYAW